jgi:hypothetical protein
VSLRLLYFIFRQVLGLALLMGRTSSTKDVELLVLRHAGGRSEGGVVASQQLGQVDLAVAGRCHGVRSLRVGERAQHIRGVELSPGAPAPRPRRRSRRRGHRSRWPTRRANPSSRIPATVSAASRTCDTATRSRREVQESQGAGYGLPGASTRSDGINPRDGAGDGAL